MMTDSRMRRSGATIRYGAGHLLVFAAALAAAWSVVTLLSGGFVLHLGPVAWSSRDPVRPLLVALVLLGAARALLPGSEFGRIVRTLTGGRDQWAVRTAVAAALAVLVVSLAWNSRAAGGSDSSCYVLQSEAFARGELTLANPLPGVLPEATPGMFAPTGFVPSRITPFAAVPICGPGLALAMAAASRIAGRDAVFVVVPVCAALAVWLTFVLGRRLDDDVTGAAAAVLFATSPIFIYQSVQPMSDVPAAALWLAALTATARGDQRGQILGGVCASLAVLMRPNLALIVIPLVFLSFRPFRRNLPFLLAMAPGLAVMAWLNAARYGSPLSSGYGSTDVLFSFAHVGPNLSRYPRWLMETETPLLAAAVLAPAWAWRHRARAPLVLVSLAAVVLTFATYLAYTVFDDWWYLRFLLPAVPVLTVLSVAMLLELTRGRPRVRVSVAILACAILGARHLQVARTHHVLDLQVLESRFAITGRYAGRALPANAVVLAVQQSGSIRYHGGRATIAWDAIPPRGLDATIDALRAAGRPAYIALEDGEEPGFRARFSGQHFGALDWPPHAEIHGPGRVRLYDPGERAAYLSGARVATESVR
jgi:hypothetical protein